MKTAICCLALAAATPARAQSAPTDAAGEDIVVTASRSGEGIALRDLPASVTLLSAEDLEHRQTRLVADVLRDVPGLAVSRTGVGATDVRVRGTEANHVLVLIDGIEASDPFQGQFDFSSLLADEAARVEVLRGQQSSLYGSDAIGGVIQYITLTGREAPGVSVRAEGGSFGTVAGGARAAGFGDAFDYAVSASAFRTEGTPTARGGERNVGFTTANASAKLTWTPSPAFKLTGVARYTYADALTNDSEFDGTSPRFGQIVDTPGSHARTDQVYGLVRGDLALAGGTWNTALTGQIADFDRKGYSAFGVSSGDHGRRYKSSLVSSYRFGSERVVQRVTGAVDFEREAFANTTPGGFYFTGTRATENWGLVGEYELTVDDAFSAGASVRHDANDRFADTTTWRAQAGYRLPFGLRVRGAYGTGVKNPGYYELYGIDTGRYIGNPDLSPERSRGWEAGVDQEFAGARATIGATYFDSTLQDEIYTTYSADFVPTPANRPTRSRQHGIEAFASARPVPQLKLDLAYTWLDAKEDGVNEVRRPHHVASANATVFSRDERVSGTLTVRYNGRQDDVTFTDPTFATTPIVSLREYVLVNLNAEARLTDRVTLFGRVENLLGERYEEVFSFASPGRAATAGVRARF